MGVVKGAGGLGRQGVVGWKTVCMLIGWGWWCTVGSISYVQLVSYRIIIRKSATHVGSNAAVVVEGDVAAAA